MTIRLLSIFMLSFLFSFFSTCKKSTNPIAIYGNLAVVNSALIDGACGNPIENIDTLLNVKMVIHGGEIIKGGI